MIRYFLKEAPAEETDVTLRILEDDGSIIQSYTSKGKGAEKVATEAGMNQFVWDLSYPDAEGFEGLIMWAGNLSGPRAVPGMYQARLIVGDDSMSAPIEIKIDSRLSSNVADLQARHDFVATANATLSEAHRGIKSIRDVRAQVKDVTERAEGMEGADALSEAGDELLGKMKEIEETIYQTKNQSRQDPLNFPIKLNNKLAAVKGTVQRGEYPPTDQQMAVKQELSVKLEAELEKLDVIMENDLPAFNKMAKDLDLPAIFTDKKPRPAM